MLGLIITDLACKATIIRTTKQITHVYCTNTIVGIEFSDWKTYAQVDLSTEELL